MNKKLLDIASGGVRFIFSKRMIRISHISLLSLTLLFILTVTSFASSTEKRILSLVDYIGGDYHNAVLNGEVINSSEYAEMLEFSSEVTALFESLKSSQGDKASVELEINELSALVTSKASVQRVEEISKSIKDKLIASYGIIPHPQSMPSLENGKALYNSTCAHCHGASGEGDGILSQGLNPPPTNLVDPDFYSGLSPFKVHNTMTFGIEGTAMPAFPQIPEDQKWDVAFYVMSLPAFKGVTSSNSNIISGIDGELKDYKVLATLSNSQLSEGLGENLNDEEKNVAVSYLRSGFFEESSFSSDSAISLTKQMISESMNLYKAGNERESYEKAIDAYMLGFEQIEPDLIIKDRDFKAQVEASFGNYRNAIKSQKPVDQVQNLYGILQADLSTADSILQSGSSSKLISFLNSLAIIIREGLEAILIIAAIIAFLSATGSRKAIRYIHYGWIAAIFAGLITWFLAQTVISVSNAQREIIEGITALTAAAVLFYVSYWLITKIEVKKWKEYIQGKVENAVSRNSVIALASVSFFAVYREAFETVLFYQALWYQAESSQSAVIWGIVVGAVILVALFFVIFKMALRIPLKYFFTLTSIFLYFLAFILLGKGINELQVAGVINTTPIDFLPYIDAVGFYPTVQTVIPQALLVAAFVFGAFWIIYSQREMEKKELVVTVSRIADDVKSMQVAFSHIKGHIVEWRRCEDIDLEAEDLDNQIKDVVSHVDELETKLGDFYNVVSKNTEAPKKVH